MAGKGLDKKESVIKISYRKKYFAAVRTAVRAIEIEFSRENVSKIEDKDLESLTLVLQIQPSPVSIFYLFLFFFFFSFSFIFIFIFLNH